MGFLDGKKMLDSLQRDSRKRGQVQPGGRNQLTSKLNLNTKKTSKRSHYFEVEKINLNAEGGEDNRQT